MDATPKVTIRFLDGEIKVIEAPKLGYKIDDDDARGCIKVFHFRKTYIYPLTSIKEVVTDL